MLMVSGTADPVGGYSKGVWKVAQNYADLGLQHIKVLLYEGARHELLSETNYGEVYEDIVQWIDNLKY